MEYKELKCLGYTGDNNQEMCSKDLVEKKRDLGIDVIKFLATLLVINSHMSICYPNYEFFATGGAIGNSLFFFASGFTLFMGEMTNFPNYYKKRISRIYPSVLAMGVFSGIIFNSSASFLNQLGGYWFVNCIMIYYAILWVARRLKINLKLLIILSLCFTWGVYLFFFDFKSVSLIYGFRGLRVYLYFAVMALGAYMGRNRDNFNCKKYSPILMFMSIVLWYGINYFFEYSVLQLFGIPVLLAICYYTYTVTKSNFFIKLLEHKKIRVIIRFIGTLCLEVYLIQFNVISSNLNFIFPLNIPIIIIECILGGYMISIIGHIIAQTFYKEPYDWKKIINPIM